MTHRKESCAHALSLFAGLVVFMTFSSCMNHRVEQAESDPYRRYKQVGGEHGVCMDPREKGCNTSNR